MWLMSPAVQVGPVIGCVVAFMPLYDVNRPMIAIAAAQLVHRLRVTRWYRNNWPDQTLPVMGTLIRPLSRIAVALPGITNRVGDKFFEISCPLLLSDGQSLRAFNTGHGHVVFTMAHSDLCPNYCWVALSNIFSLFTSYRCWKVGNFGS